MIKKVNNVLFAAFAVVGVSAYAQDAAQIDREMQEQIRAECAQIASEIAARYGNPEFAIMVTNSQQLGTSMAEAIPIIEQGLDVGAMIEAKEQKLDELAEQLREQTLLHAEHEQKLAKIDQELTEQTKQIQVNTNTIEQQEQTIAQQEQTIQTQQIALGELDSEFIALMKRMELEKEKVAKYEQAVAAITHSFGQVRNEMNEVFALVNTLMDDTNNVAVSEKPQQEEVKPDRQKPSKPSNEQLNADVSPRKVQAYVLSRSGSDARALASKALAERSVSSYDSDMQPVF